jgi:hypothetical protein
MFDALTISYVIDLVLPLPLTGFEMEIAGIPVSML